MNITNKETNMSKKITMHELIIKWKISQQNIAREIGMPESTFKNKINPNQTAYDFTEKELSKIVATLTKMRNDIDKIVIKITTKKKPPTRRLLKQIDIFK